MSQSIMNALDAVAGSQASAYITLADGNRYCFMQLYSFESNMEIYETADRQNTDALLALAEVYESMLALQARVEALEGGEKANG